MAIDAFLVLSQGAGAPTVAGETLDKEFDPKEGIQLKKFRFASQQTLLDDEDESEDASDTDAPDKQWFAFSAEKEVDEATPGLLDAYCRHAKNTQGKKDGVFSQALVYLRKASGGKRPLKFMVLIFKEVFIKTWSLKNTDEDSLPEEVLEFCFQTCTMQYYPQTSDGKGAPVVSGHADFFKAKTSLSK